MSSRNRKGPGKGAFPRRGRRGCRRGQSNPSPLLLQHWGPFLISTPLSDGGGVYFRSWNQARALSLAEELYRKAGFDPQGEILLKDVAGLLRSLREEGNWDSLVLEALARMVTDEPEAARMMALNGNPGEWHE
jgi:hypothetical protein